MKKAFKIITNTILVTIFLFGALVIFSFLPITGNVKLLTVLSGSMEPAIHTGSLVVVKPMGEYNVGDVVTRNTNEGNVTITHRVVTKDVIDGETLLGTKGDANNVADNEKIPQSMIMGKVILNIPYLGYLINFAKTTKGLMLIIVIPAVIIVYEELGKMKKEIVKMTKKKKETKESGDIKDGSLSFTDSQIPPDVADPDSYRKKNV